MNPVPPISVAPVPDRRPEPGGFGAALKAAASRVARGVGAALELAAPLVPGGAAVAGALRSVAGAAGAAGGASDDAQLLAATRALQQEARTFNLQYLQLQEGMQRESREFSALSNVLKVKHDSAKSAIHNIQ